MTNYNLEEFKQWLKTKGKENLMISCYYYGIRDEKLICGNLVSSDDDDIEPWLVEGELAQEFEIWKTDYFNKKKKKKKQERAKKIWS